MPTIDSGPQRTAPEEPTLEFSVRVDSATRIIRLSGELDAETACLFGSVIDAQAAQDHVRVSVDVSDLRFFDVPGFDALVAADVGLRRRGGGLVVVGGSALFRRVAEITGVLYLLGAPQGAPPAP